MNERAVTQIVSKIVCALPMALVFYEEPIISKFAEGVISFLGVVNLFIGLVAVLLTEQIAKQLVAKGALPVSELALSIASVLSMFLIVASAGLGWYWVAAGFLLEGVGFNAVNTRMKTLVGNK